MALPPGVSLKSVSGQRGVSLQSCRRNMHGREQAVSRMCSYSVNGN